MLAEMKPLLELLEHYFRETRKLVEGLSTEQLNWRPISAETQNEATNSLYGLVVHIALGVMQIAGRAAGKSPPDFPELHNGNMGIETVGEGPDRAIELLNEAQIFVQDVLENMTAGQLEEVRQRRVGNWVAEPKTVHWMLLHVLDHTALHVGHMELTRQLVLKQL